MNQLLALGKDVRKLKGEASEDEESSSESSEEELPKRKKTSTPAPTSFPRREKGQKKTITLPDPVQMDLSQVDDDFIQREAGASPGSVDCARRYVCVFSSYRLEAELEQKRQDAVMKELDKRTRERAAKAAAAAKASADAAMATNTPSHDMANICSA